VITKKFDADSLSKIDAIGVEPSSVQALKNPNPLKDVED